MTQTLDLARSVASKADLVVERTGITFRNPSPDRVHIEVVVRNTGARPSEPEVMRIESAPFGAFLPWRPLLSTLVPPIRPGGRFVVALDVLAPATRPIGSFGTLPPRSLLTALFPEDERESREIPNAMSIPNRGRRSLAPNLFGLLCHPTAHWVGNLNVFVGSREVERHMARSLRIHPGKTNSAMFMLGDGPDAYSFHLEGEGTGWDATLRSLRGRCLEIDTRSQALIHEGEWIDVTSSEPVLLMMRPPAGCREGSLEVHVHQHSSGKEAVVEFTFDAAAAGPGCYVV